MIKEYCLSNMYLSKRNFNFFKHFLELQRLLFIIAAFNIII